MLEKRMNYLFILYRIFFKKVIVISRDNRGACNQKYREKLSQSYVSSYFVKIFLIFSGFPHVRGIFQLLKIHNLW